MKVSSVMGIDFVIDVDEDDGLLLPAIPEDMVPPGVGEDILLAGDDGDVDTGPDLLVGVLHRGPPGADDDNSYHLAKMMISMYFLH